MKTKRLATSALFSSLSLWVTFMLTPGSAWAQASSSKAAGFDNGHLASYHYTVTDVATRGLTAQQLFNEMRSDYMDLKGSVCSNRAHMWGYDMFRKHHINVGRIFVFFTRDVWKKAKKGWMYHAGTYVIENGEVKVLEGSYPDEVKGPLTITQWMDTEMEGKEDARNCMEITEKDQDLTEYFYHRNNLPRVRENGKPGAPCYYRRVPGYIPYPATVAELEFGVDEDGAPIRYSMDGFHQDDVQIACEDAYAGSKLLKKATARSFCKKYLRF